MKAEELIKRLQRVPPEAEVLVVHEWYNGCDHSDDLEEPIVHANDNAVVISVGSTEWIALDRLGLADRRSMYNR